jgi:hypothetical protein
LRDAGKNISDNHRVGIQHHLYPKIGIRVLFQILPAYPAEPFANFPVFKRHKGRWCKNKIGSGIGFNVHYNTPGDILAVSYRCFSKISIFGKASLDSAELGLSRN